MVVLEFEREEAGFESSFISREKLLSLILPGEQVTTKKKTRRKLLPRVT